MLIWFIVGESCGYFLSERRPSGLKTIGHVRPAHSRQNSSENMALFYSGCRRCSPEMARSSSGRDRVLLHAAWSCWYRILCGDLRERGIGISASCLHWWSRWNTMATSAGGSRMDLRPSCTNSYTASSFMGSGIMAGWKDYDCLERTSISQSAILMPRYLSSVATCVKFLS
jgi:hypothetical protein